MDFLKPNWVKVILFVSLASLFLSRSYDVYVGGGILATIQGWPLPIDTPEVPEEVKSPLLKVFLVIDLIFWYLISCFLVWIYKKIKKKS